MSDNRYDPPPAPGYGPPERPWSGAPSSPPPYGPPSGPPAGTPSGPPAGTPSGPPAGSGSWPGAPGAPGGPGLPPPPPGGPGFGGPPPGGPGFGGPPPGGPGFGGPPPGAPGFGGPPPPAFGAPPAPFGAPPPRKSKTPVVVGIICAVLLLCVAGVVGVFYTVQKTGEAAVDALEKAASAPAVPPAGQGGNQTLILEVAGDGPANVTFNDPTTGKATTENSVDLPWRRTFTVQTGDSTLTIVSLTASRSGEGEGRLSCKATLDGTVIVSKTEEGFIALPMCFKTL